MVVVVVTYICLCETLNEPEGPLTMAEQKWGLTGERADRQRAMQKAWLSLSTILPVLTRSSTRTFSIFTCCNPNPTTERRPVNHLVFQTQT